jgi:hypothetical protein
MIIDLPVASRKILAKPKALGWFLSLGGAGYTKLNFPPVSQEGILVFH